MDAYKYRDALTFMFLESGNPKWWKCGALMKSMNPEGKPPNDLCLAEAESIFHELKKKELLLPFINQNNESCYLLNECKESEWREEIKNAILPWYKKTKVIKAIGKVMLWTLLAFLAGYLGALGEKALDKSGDIIGVVTTKISRQTQNKNQN